MNSTERVSGADRQGFSKFVVEAFEARESTSSPNASSEERYEQRQNDVRAATKGVLGMMHFASFDSPILLEALGDLLLIGWPEDMTQIAGRAYLRAAQLSKDKSAAEKYKSMARAVLLMHEDYGMHRTGDFVPKLEKELAKEMADGDKWFAAIEANEQEWIAANRDVDREFAAVYYDSLEATLASAQADLDGEWQYHRYPYYDRLIFLTFGLICVAPIGIAIGGGVIYLALRRRRATLKSVSTGPSNN